MLPHRALTVKILNYLILHSYHSPFSTADPGPVTDLFVGHNQTTVLFLIEALGGYIRFIDPGATVTNMMLSHATFPGTPSYGGVRTWVEGSQTCGGRT